MSTTPPEPTPTPTPTPEPTPTPTPTPPPASSAKPEPTDELGAGGIAALQAERTARAEAERKLKEFEDKEKSDLQLATEKAAELERENAELKSGKTRAEVAAAKGVPAELLSGNSKDELEASADALIAFRGEKGAGRRLVVPSEGQSSTPQPTEEQEFVGSLFGGGD